MQHTFICFWTFLGLLAGLCRGTRPKNVMKSSSFSFLEIWMQNFGLSILLLLITSTSQPRRHKIIASGHDTFISHRRSGNRSFHLSLLPPSSHRPRLESLRIIATFFSRAFHSCSIMHQFLPHICKPFIIIIVPWRTTISGGWSTDSIDNGGVWCIWGYVELPFGEEE